MSMLLLQAALESAEQTVRDIKLAMEQDYPAPDPPNDISSDLPWNFDSPWPFPTQDKPASLSNKKYITLHHSAGHRDTTSIAHWNNLHTKYKNWPHVGYHFGISSVKQGGAIGLYQLNRIGEFTWHDARNYDTIGVCIAGDLRPGHDISPTNTQAQLTGQLLAWLIPQLDNFIGVTFHKRIQSTACPGAIEQWQNKIIKATVVYGLDITSCWDVTLKRTTRSRLQNVLTRTPPMSDYKDV